MTMKGAAVEVSDDDVKTESTPIFSWEQLKELVLKKGGPAFPPQDRVNGTTNSQSNLRLFGKKERDVRVTFYRDKHAWCPYCQKIWLWLEEMKIPYKVVKVTMFCYGKKENWYLSRVPSGMLPALELDGKIITESDVILETLEEEFGPLHRGMNDSSVYKCRKLERVLFRAWCMWLCSPSSVHASVDQRCAMMFEDVVRKVEEKIGETSGPFLLEKFSTADIVLAPYIERMNASLFYYKGYRLRDPKERPRISSWFDAMEAHATYRGTQSDIHTHVHDLPPQMGGCYSNSSAQAIKNQKKVDCGPWDKQLPDVGYGQDLTTARIDAAHRVIKHKKSILSVNPYGDKVTDVALRSALTAMLTGKNCSENIPVKKDADRALRYIRDRVNVPRDMSVHAARELRTALEKTASGIGAGKGPVIPVKHRRDQDPKLFGR